MNKEIKVLELTSGMSIIGNVQDNNDGATWTVFSGAVIMPTQNQQGQGMAFSMIPWPMFIDRDQANKTGVIINTSTIVSSYVPGPDLVKNYKSGFLNTGLITPPKGLILS